jgi:AcrR family transcriptional regulator
MDAAYRVFSERGYHSTRIEDIALETGMAQGLFYRYFQNKLDIFSQILDGIITRITLGVMSDAAGSSYTLEEYTQQMRRGVENIFDIFVEDPLLSRLLLYEALSINEEINAKLQNALDLFAEYSSSYIKDGIKKGFLRPDIEIKETAYAFNALVFEGVRRIMLAENKKRAKETWTKAIVDLMIKGTAEPGALK